MTEKYNEVLSDLLSTMPKGSALNVMNFSYLPGSKLFFLTPDARSTEVLQSVLDYGARISPLVQASMSPARYSHLFPDNIPVPVENLTYLRRVTDAFASLSGVSLLDMSAGEVQQLFSNGGTTLEALATVAGVSTEEVISFAVMQAEDNKVSGDTEAL